MDNGQGCTYTYISHRGEAEEGCIIVIFAIAYCDYCCCSQVSMNDKRYSGNTKQQDPFLSNEKLHLEFNISSVVNSKHY